MDGTNEREIAKALRTYLNTTGAGDYELKKLIGEKLLNSKTKNAPNFSFAARTKMSWFPERHVDFAGQTSPPSTKYNIKTDREYKSLKFSVGNGQRFNKPKHLE